MFSSGPQYPKLKTNLRLSINRLKLLGKKKTEMTQKSRKEIADYIAGHKEDRARIRVEHIIREDYIVEAYELLEMYCDLLLARFGLIQQMKELDDGLEEAINSVLWAAPRIVADVQEFKIIADQLAVKYGKPFAEACRVNQFGKVNPKLMHKLGVVAPPKILVEKYMIEIAKSCNVPFTPDENVMREDEVAAAEAMLIDFQNTGQQGGGWMYPQPPGQMPPQMMQQPPPAYPHVAPTQSMFEEAEAREANRHQQPPHQPPPHQAFNYPAPRQPNQQSIDEKSTYSDLPSPTDSYPDLSAQHQSNNEPEDISNLKMPRNETGAASAPDPGLSDSVMPPPPPAPAPSDSAPPAPGFVLPTLPDPPSDDFPKPPDSPPGNGGGDEGIDYDDLTRRFNNLKKHKLQQKMFDEIPEENTLRFSDTGLVKFKWDTEEEADEFSYLIETFDHLVELDMTGTSVGEGAARRLAKALEKHPELTHAVFEDMFKSRMKNEIPPALKLLCDAMLNAGCRLKRFSISDNAMGPIGAEGFKHFLRSEACFGLEDLGLNNLGLGITGGKEVTAALMDCHAASKESGRPLKLKSIIVGRNRQETPGAIRFAEVFRTVGTMESVTMHQNGITPEGIEALAESLLVSPNIRVINLCDNTAKLRGARALAKVIRRQRHIEEIDLSDCLLKNSGARALLAALREPDTVPQLRYLNLNGNEIGPDVAIELIKCMAGKPNFQHLSLADNCYGGRFNDVYNCADMAQYEVELGDNDDDQGSASEDDEDEEGGEGDGNVEQEEEEGDDEDEIVVVDDRGDRMKVAALPEMPNVSYRHIVDIPTAVANIQDYIHYLPVFDCQTAQKLAVFMLCRDLREGDPALTTKIAAVVQCCETVFSSLARLRYFGVVCSPPSAQVVNCVCSELAFLNKSCQQSTCYQDADLYGPLVVFTELVNRGALNDSLVSTLKYWITDCDQTARRCYANGPTKRAFDHFNDLVLSKSVCSS